MRTSDLWTAGRTFAFSGCSLTPVSTAINILTQVVGGLLVVGTLWSAMLTVVVPRAERPRITRYHYKFIGFISKSVQRMARDPETRNTFDSRLAPFGLITLSFVWAFHITSGFALVFWGQGTRGAVNAFLLSGSSLTTLGIRSSDEPGTMVLVVIEALIGLGLVGLVISYLPTVYSAYLDREIAVARLEVRAGRPPHPLTFLQRSNDIGWLDEMDEVWHEWENWFLEIEETHSTHTSLSFFRSAQYGRSWLQTAGIVLDAAALMQSTLDVERSPQGALCIRAGFEALGSLADTFNVERPVDPAQTDPISMHRTTFDQLCIELRSAGIPLKPDLDQAWVDFAGWRVNYDASLMGLLEYLRIEPGEWFGDQYCKPTIEITRRGVKRL